jgi:hypothetical protein
LGDLIGFYTQKYIVLFNKFINQNVQYELQRSKGEKSNTVQVFQYIKGQGKIAYVPFGLYRLDSTLVIPIGVSVVGEAWATFTGNGNYFKDSSNPKPVVQVGNPGLMNIWERKTKLKKNFSLKCF